MHIKIFLLLFLSVFTLANNEALIREIEEVDKKNKELFAEVKVYIDRLMEEEKKSLSMLGLDADSSVKELQQALEKSYNIAKLNGLDLKKLKSLYELSKKVILNSDFVKYDSKQSVSTTNSFQAWFDITGSNYADIQEEKAQNQAQRAAFYKKTTIQYIKALNAKDANDAYNEFKKYVDALRTIQSADTDTLIAQADLLVAEQKLVADLSSGLPLVGEAMDIMMIVSGEDLSGQQLSNFERGFTFVALITPEVLTQALKRNPAIAKALGKFGASVKNMPKKTLAKIKSKKVLKEYLESLSGASDEVLKWRKFYEAKIQESKRLASMDKSLKDFLSKDIENSLEKVYDRPRNLGENLSEKISNTAKKRDEIIIIRPTNDDLSKRLAEGAYTKGMNVKGKSANSGIASGYVPTKQKFSKLEDAKEIAKFQKKVNESLETVEVAGTVISPQRVSSKQLVVTRGDVKLEGIEIFKKGSDESIAVFKRADGKIVNEKLEELSEEVLKNYDLKNAKSFEVLTDMKGNYLTADIDLLAVGSKKRDTIMQNDALMGNIKTHEMATVDEMNRAMKDNKYPDRQLVHHGGENQFMNKESALDFPLTAYSPDGKKAILENEKEVKKYFHMQKLKGYDLQPNPYWGWGEYNPQIGYK